LKLSSFEGLDRGASKEQVYLATRLKAQEPSRLFIDAQHTEAWRDKHFFSVTDNHADAGQNDSVMIHLLAMKRGRGVAKGEYFAESETQSCVKDGAQMGEYQAKHPEWGMPFGLPELSEQEYLTLSAWLQQGAHGPTASEQEALGASSPGAAVQIMAWEAFLNRDDAKYAVTARYLYEHFFLAHIHFDDTPEEEFYELVRSTTPPGEPVDVIATVRPYDDPGSEPFYYRFRKIHSTIVYKTHMVVGFGASKLERIRMQFIDTPWLEAPHRVSYDTTLSANPFEVYAQIPPAVRYRFLLDHSEYIVRTFIRGPVCKGQIALNVIHDHFWVTFMDPAYDVGVREPEFLRAQSHNLSLPVEQGSSARVWNVFSDEYRDRYADFYDAKMRRYEALYHDGLPLDALWKGEQGSDAPLLTVYRHFDSASVHKGVLGGLPRTLWTIDYAQFERIYYALVAGFDVFGNVTHQTNVRRYMDYLRIEGELNFVHFLPRDTRLATIRSWYLSDAEFQNLNYERIAGDIGDVIDFHTDEPKRELIEKLVDEELSTELGIGFDPYNYYRIDEHPPALPKTFDTMSDYINGFRALNAPGSSFIRKVNSYNINVLYLRIRNVQGEDKMVSMVINRWHDNVNALFNERDRLDPSKDSIDFFPFSVGSYPNYFIDIDASELPLFFDLMANFEDNDYYMGLIKKFGINRADPRFWETFEWFQKHFKARDPLHAGLYDLNRYYHEAW
jgi:hypothetical protein